MRVYAGIDEAGYGPMFGPMTVGRCVLNIPNLPPAPTRTGGLDPGGPPDLWKRLSKAVCRRIGEAKSKKQPRIAVNDSKKLTSKAAGVRHLERGVLAFLALGDQQPGDVAELLDTLGETRHRRPEDLPAWYTPTDDAPWQTLPSRNEADALALDRGLLRHTAHRIGVELGQPSGLGVAVVYEDEFNTRVAQTHSKAAVSFTCVGRHLRHVWDHHAAQHPVVVIDRQGGRQRYRDPLALLFPDDEVDVVEESATVSAYEVVGRNPEHRMAVRFETEADANHMPVALASMTAKYVRELLMHRLKVWFAQRCPDVKPTAGYGTDGNRFGREIAPHLGRLGLTMDQVRRQS